MTLPISEGKKTQWPSIEKALKVSDHLSAASRELGAIVIQNAGSREYFVYTLARQKAQSCGAEAAVLKRALMDGIMDGAIRATGALHFGTFTAHTH
jgi:hypothetical protein